MGVSKSTLTIRSRTHSEALGSAETRRVTEQDPLLGSTSGAAHRERGGKPWYRPRPLWLAPFAITASLCRSMTLAPRTEVFTQLACEELRPSRHHHTAAHSVLVPYANLSLADTRFPSFLVIDGPVPFILDKTPIVQLSLEDVLPSGSEDYHENDGDLPTVGDPPIDCLTDPAVQAGAAKLQTVMVTTMGILSALTTGWWGQYGDRYGRTKVLASAVSGLFFTDVMFIIASHPPEILRGHAHKLLIVAPVVEGLLGGWTTLQGATHAYISDCTSHGSRAHIFSRFTGVFYIGFSLGPEIAALILRSTHMTTLVFYTSAVCAFVNIFLLLFVFPESLGTELRERNVKMAAEARDRVLREADGKTGLYSSAKRAVIAFVKPLGILGPKPRIHGRGRDWSMTLLATTLFGYFLSAGLFQIKYLYAEHMFSWNAEKLSYYITAVGSARALHLLVILPTVIRIFKPTPTALRKSKSKGKSRSSKSKALPGLSGLRSEIRFDLLVARLSLALDILSHVLVTAASDASQGLFVGFTLLTSFGAGIVPAMHSVAMSITHVRGEEGQEESTGGKGGAEVGKLFGAFAVLQATGGSILGPMLFGSVYSLTVSAYPKAVFLLAACLLAVSMTSLLLIRPPRVDVPIQIRVDVQVEVEVERARGRSRRSKDISSGLR